MSLPRDPSGPGSAPPPVPRAPSRMLPAATAAATPARGISAEREAPAGMPKSPPVGMPVATPFAPARAVSAAPKSPPAPVVALDEREHAIEVAAMLGDSVVGLKHCAIATAAPRLDHRAWFIIAGLALLVGAFAFATTLRAAARNDVGRHEWLAKKRPMHAFRPEVVGAGYDVAGFGGLGLTLFAATMGVVRLRQRRLHPLFRIGTSPEVELPLADATVASFPVVSARDGRLVVRYPAACSGELMLDGVSAQLGDLTAAGRARALGDGSCEMTMPQRARMRLRLGSAQLLLSVVPRPSQQLPLFAGQLEQRVTAYLGGALAVHLAIVGLLRVIPEEATVPGFGADDVNDITVSTEGTAMDTKPEELEQGAAADAAASDSQSSAAMALSAGAAGDARSTEANKRMAVKRTGETEQLARIQAIAAATRSGILGNEGLRSLNAVALTGTADLASGLDATFAAGTMDGEEVGTAYGNFGGAPTGIGPGGGGWDGIIGSGGKYRTIGSIPGNGVFLGSCTGPGPCGNSPLRSRQGVAPTPVVIGVPKCGGETCIDKDIIRRYVKRQMEKIRYCYEKELLSDANLEGTVQTTFVISPTGAVLSSKGSGMNANVSSCVAGVIGAIVFPRGAGDAIQVNYPFTFRRPGA